MLIDEIKKKLSEAIKSGNKTARDVLKVALGEIQLAQTRGDNVTDDHAQKLIRKIIEGNGESLKALANQADERVEKLRAENNLLESLLPQQWSEAKIREFLRPMLEQLSSCKSSGQAVGLAMKTLKQANAPVDGKVVSSVVNEILQSRQG